MPSWSEFVEKDSSLRYIEQLNWIAKNQVSDLASVWYDAERYYLARRKLEELEALHVTVKNDIQELEEDVADAQKELETTKDKGFTNDYIRTANNQLRLLRHVEIEIASTISYLTEIPVYTVPDWFVEFLKTVVFSPDSIEIKRSDDWQPVVQQSKLPWWKKK
jgi:hypothetical protein